eukprot:236173-Rhodomonas_salina.1
MQAIDDAQHQPTAGCRCYNCNERGRGAQLGRGGMVVASGARGGSVVASKACGGMVVAGGASGGMVVAGGAHGGMVVAAGASNTYAMPFGQATGAALAAQQQAHEQYYNYMVFYGEQWVQVAEQESLAYSATEPPPPEATEEDDPADTALFTNTIYPGRTAQLGRCLFEAFDFSGGRLCLDDDTDDGNVNAAGISLTMPSGLYPPRPKLLVTLEAHTNAPPRIRRHCIPGPQIRGGKVVAGGASIVYTMDRQL